MLRDDSPHNVMRPPLCLLVNSAHVLSDDAEKKQIYAGQKGDGQNERGKTLGRVQPEFRIYGVNGEHRGQENGDCAQDRGGSQRNNGKCEDAVRGKF